MKKVIYIIASLFVLSTLNAQTPKGFVQVDGIQFTIDGEPYYFMGTNFWYGQNLGSTKESGDRQRLIRELDHLQQLGVKNLRVLASSEGPDDEPYRIVPAMQTAPGKYNKAILEGLDFLLDEMKKRDMHAVMVLNNMWPWSAGMAQYLVWAGEADSIPYPPPHPNGSWTTYQVFTSKFYESEKAKQLFRDHISFIVNRKNSVNGITYKDDPTIMSWQLGNEPRGIYKTKVFNEWIHETAKYIKSLDPHHLVSTGCEGATSSQFFSGTNPNKNHSSEYIDYVTAHVWVQNWQWYDPENHENTFEEAKKKAANYVQDHIWVAEALGKPLVFEEFGIARDKASYDPASTTKVRDAYYEHIFKLVHENAQSGGPLVGVNFWAWGGEARPKLPYGSMWDPGDPIIGDPPHERQGWYSVYNKDESTLKVIEEYADKLNALR